MFKYFKELLRTLHSIEKLLEESNQYHKRLDQCVITGHHKHGDVQSISTKHWNE